MPHQYFRRNPSPRFKAQRVALFACLAALNLACISAFAQSPAAPVAAAPVAVAPVAGALNPVTAALQKAGVKRCTSQIQKVTAFLNDKARTGTTVFPLAANPDDSLVSMSSEIISTNAISYAGATFAPRADGCSAVYEQVTHWQNKCEEVHAAQYPGFKPKGVLQAQIKVYYNSAATQVMMVPAGTGCVVIKKEIVH